MRSITTNKETAMKTIHSKKKIYADIKYAKQELARLANLIALGDWDEVRQGAMELSGVCASIENMASDNLHGVEDSYCSWNGDN